MKNTEQLKALIRNMAKSKKISAQIILQYYMLERLLERISMSQYRINYILKGGFLIAAITGLSNRATMDMDATMKGIVLNRENIINIFTEICNIDANDNVKFSIKKTELILEHAEYTGIRISIEAVYPPITVPLKIDLTTGDKITPNEMEFEYKFLFESRSIHVLAYNLETILAEKLETIISRGAQNTRPRDYYDVYLIQKLLWDKINTHTLKSALHVTSKTRGTESDLKNYTNIMADVINNEAMKNHWKTYQVQYSYAQDVPFSDTCHVIRNMLDVIFQ